MGMTDWQRTPTICTDDYRRLTSYIVRLVRQQVQNILPNLLSSNLTISRTQKCNNADFGRTRKIAKNNQLRVASTLLLPIILSSQQQCKTHALRFTHNIGKRCAASSNKQSNSHRETTNTYTANAVNWIQNPIDTFRIHVENLSI